MLVISCRITWPKIASWVWIIVAVTTASLLIACGDSSSPLPAPTPSPSPSPTGTPTPSPSPTPTGTPTPSPSPTPTGTPTPSPTPTPDPVFTSTAPTDADESELYTYEVAATDPAGGSITFSLISSPPDALLTESTLTWTPDHAHSRVANEFQIQATSSTGESATQSFTITPKGTVRGVSRNTFLTKTGPVLHPNPVATHPPVVYVDNGQGGYEVLTGAGNDEDGTFSVPHVPAGPYLISFPNAFVETTVPYYARSTSSDLELGIELVGRPGCTITQFASGTPMITFQLGLSNPLWTDGYMIWYSGNSFRPSSPEGAITNPYHGIVHWQTPCLLDSSQGDDAYLLHYRPSEFAPFASTIAETAGISWPQMQNTPVIISGSLHALQGGSQPLHPNIAVTQFDELIASSLPEVSTAFTLYQNVRFSVVAQPYATHVGRGGGPDLLSWIGMTSTDFDMGDLSFINPFPDHMEYMLFVRGVGARVSTTENTWVDVDGGLGIARAAMPTVDDPIVPTLGMVGSPKIDGANLLAEQPQISYTPTLTWDPPTLGAATNYDVTIYVFHTGQPQVGITVLRTTETQLKLPPGILEYGDLCIFKITAYASTGSSDSAPFADTGDYAYASTVSSMQLAEE